MTNLLSLFNKFNMFNKFNATLSSAVLTYLILFYASPLLAEDSFYKRRAEGWHWYQDRKNEEQHKEEQKSHQAHQNITPTQLLKLYRRELERRLHLAIFFPTLENVKAYQELQKDLMERGQLFADKWMQSISFNPHLDFTSTYPINQIGRHTYIDEENKLKHIKLKTLSKSYGFFFFFKGDCPYCHTFAPIVKRFALRYGWTVKAVSLDGGKLKEYPKPHLDNGIAEKLSITHVPALIAVNPKTQTLLPISYGISSEDEMELRIMTLIGKP